MARSKKTSPPAVKGKADEEVGDLRRARPTRRILEQVRGYMKEISRHLEILESWASGNGIANCALAEARVMSARCEKLIEHLGALDASGFSPPRKCYTASTKEGDIVQVLEAHREFYAELMEPAKMTNLTVVKKQPGKGGGLVVEAADGSRMRAAIAHVVKTS